MTEETVWYSSNCENNIYHTRENCRYVSDAHSTRRRSVLDAWDYSECQLCQHDGSVDAYVPSKQSTTHVNVDE